LDLYSGSGGLGFEALSRGAESVVFVESNSKAVEILQKNAANLQAAAKVVKQTAKSFATSANLNESKFDLILIDPPYKVANQEILEVIEGLVSGEFLQENAILVIERPTRDLFVWPAVIKEIKNKRYGDNTLYYGSVA
jgi:16S rRNA (guanine966-N2)-methyltransferase